ncbi:uncharacterized protein LOC143059489 [Mytilus galloprovincialis]|uniref:uncharacterized protein LOC143059489 n=1 Tax=Mytilus galloprovincialis TaxID=29158 RepID=UPI003F7C8D67
MDLTNGHVLFSLILILSVAYLYHINLVLQDKVETQSSYVQNIQRKVDIHNEKLGSQGDLLKTIWRDFKKKVGSHDDILKTIDEKLEFLSSKVDRAEIFQDVQKDMTETIGKVLEELKDITDSLNESVERLEDAENRRSSSGIVSYIKKGISKVVQIIYNLFGSVTRLLE